MSNANPTALSLNATAPSAVLSLLRALFQATPLGVFMQALNAGPRPGQR